MRGTSGEEACDVTHSCPMQQRDTSQIRMWMAEIAKWPRKIYKLYYEQWHRVLERIRAYVSRLFCEGCVVVAAAAVVV